MAADFKQHANFDFAMQYQHCKVEEHVGWVMPLA
jgi:hypothetical protein